MSLLINRCAESTRVKDLTPHFDSRTILIVVSKKMCRSALPAVFERLKMISVQAKHPNLCIADTMLLNVIGGLENSQKMV